MKQIADALFGLVLSLWVGGIAIFTFLVTPAVFRQFTRDEAGRIVGVLFTGYYYPYNLILSVLALGAFGVLAWGSWRTAHWAALILLVAAVLANGYVFFKLHPEIRRVKQQIASFETTPRDHPLRQRFGLLHGLSAAINLFVLGDGVVLLLLAPTLKR